ncbi:complement C4-B-like isoform X2 [Chiloscyllium punctatum]|uniref:complement C4-B-like isoform X2 n=1 Tax=Chiloscyllium punctatum TaxID=137246 RepID=UPI003B63E252
MELLVFLLCASWCMSVSEQAPSYLITAPRIVRIGVKETVTIQVFEARENVNAIVYLLNHKNMLVCSERHLVKLNHTNNFAEVLFVQILPENATRCKLPNKKRYITLAVEIPSLLPKRRMVHLQLLPQPYFIFIETDKPTYRPNDTVRFQTFSLDHEMKLSNCDVDVEIRQSTAIVAKVRSRKHGSTAVCRGEVQLPPSLIGDFEIQGPSALYSAYVGHKIFQIKEHDDMEEKKSDAGDVLKYKINLTKTRRYFIPGASYQILALVSHLDGSPVPETPIKIKIIISAGKALEATQEGLTDRIGELSLSFNVPENAKDIYISVSAGDKAVGNDVSEEIAIKCQDSKQMYLHIGVTNALLYPGDIINVTLTPFSQVDISSVNYFYYMVLNKGKVLLFERIRKSANTSFPVTITDEMVPYFRIVAYYFASTYHDKSIISDSVRVEVEDPCSSKFQIQPALYTNNEQQELLLSVLSDRVSDVFVHAVDAQLNNPNKDIKTLWKAFYHKDFYDFGTSYGGGQNSVKVFEDAGLRLISDLMESIELSEITNVPWNREPLVHPRADIGISETHQIVHPAYEHTWMWQIENTSGQKTYRLTSDIDPPRSWEINAFRISKEGVCIAKPLMMKIDDSI